MATGSLDYFVPLVSLGLMAVTIALVGLFIRMRGRGLVVEDGVLLGSTDFAGFVHVRWGGPELRQYESSTLYVGRVLPVGARVKIRHRPGHTDQIEILGPNVRGVYLFWIAGIAGALALVFSVAIYLTT
jgi:hypothetical protein